jgi:bifunctional N-acetylglucosamine-1-phosphate-uridyltransferase/glucosamine-1-phosphate-acetyltransferase GlmU-like protein
MRVNSETFVCQVPEVVRVQDMETLLKQIENDRLREEQELSYVVTEIRTAELEIETRQLNAEQTMNAEVAGINAKAQLDSKTIMDTAKTDALGTFYNEAGVDTLEDRAFITNYLILRGVL